MTWLRILIGVAILANVLLGVDQSVSMLWPLPSSRTLTGGFADTRLDHFHGGVDLRAREPQPVLAPTDGWIERFAVNPSGYGRVIYFRMADGETAVFGHLSQFAPPIEKALRDSELVAGTYCVDVSYAEPDSHLAFARGATLAHTGDTGSGPAHLHFEIRNGVVQTDPLAHFSPIDHDKPVIVHLWWTGLSAYSPTETGNGLEPGPKDQWLTPQARPVECREPVAFFIQAYDPGPWGRNSVPKVIRVLVDGKIVREVWSGQIDLLDPGRFYDDIVWSKRRKFKQDIRRLFESPPPVAYVQGVSPSDGWLSDLNDADVAIEVEDRAGNTTTAHVSVTCGSMGDVLPLPCPESLQTRSFRLTSNNPSLAWAALSEVSPSEVRVRPDDLGLPGECILSYRLPEGKRYGLYFYERSSTSSLRSLWRDADLDGSDSICCHIRHAGTYGVGTDLTPPSVTASVLHGRIRFKVQDAQSRVDDSTIRCTVDGQTAIAEFEYGESGGWVWTPESLARGSHRVELTAADRAGNIRTLQTTLFVP